MSRLKKRYLNEVKPALNEKFSYSNPMLIPRLKSIVVTMGVAEAAKDKNILQQLQKELAQITGQIPYLTKSKKAISNFKLRQGQTVGLKVTLRGKRMYDFLDRFVNICCPRIRDFRGFKPKGDRQGNYTLGLDDQQIFPEINLDHVKKVQGMHISFTTTSKDEEQAIELLRQLGVPFRNLPVVVAG